MISVAEIRALAAEWGLREDVIEKDYVLGWLLAAIAADADLASTWVFKGGTCLRKCYYETWSIGWSMRGSRTSRSRRGSSWSSEPSLPGSPPVLPTLPRLVFARARGRMTCMNLADPKVPAEAPVDDFRSSDVSSSDMGASEHSLSYMLRNSGAVIDEVEHRDIVLQRRDGEDLYLGLLSRERGVRESLGILAAIMRVALRDPRARASVTAWLEDGLAWTRFLPPDDRAEFLDDLASTAGACVDVEEYEPLIQMLYAWKATAETYANPEIDALLREPKHGPTVPLKRPRVPRGEAR